MKFEPIIANNDLDVHLDPPGLWTRVAVICRWKDSHTFRRKWPHAAVIGPLRTLRGLDELIRNLLHNPQVRCIVLDGVDLTPDEETTKALLAVWNPIATDAHARYLAEDLRPHMNNLVWSVSLVTDSRHAFSEAIRAGAMDPVLRLHMNGVDFPPDEDRSKRITLPPLPPKAEAPAPHGDPGERVAADTLAELWPMILHRAMRFGRNMPTQHGDTRELLNLVAVIRDPVKTIVMDAGYEQERTTPHPVLGITFQQAQAYHQRVTCSEIPEGAPYSYGSRMAGTVNPEGRHIAIPHVDQFEAVNQLLAEKPDTRAAFLTPWRPDDDAGIEGGRPCLVGAWFRVIAKSIDESKVVGFTWAGDRCLTAPTHARGAPNADQRSRGLSEANLGACWAEGTHTADASADVTCRECLKLLAGQSLHLTVSFRSHDLFGAYSHNLAGICLWLIETAEKHGMAVGTLTCISFSAHVYAKDWNDANTVVEEHYDTNHQPRWDRRAAWRVELLGGEPTYDLASYHGDRIVGRTPTILRATALTPDGNAVIGVFEASTPEALRAQIERSGLCTSTGSALWLGDEIRRVAGGGS